MVLKLSNTYNTRKYDSQNPSEIRVVHAARRAVDRTGTQRQRSASLVQYEYSYS